MNKLFKICSSLLIAQQIISLTLIIIFLSFISLALLPFSAFFIIGTKICIQIGSYIEDTNTNYVESLKYIKKSLSEAEKGK